MPGAEKFGQAFSPEYDLTKEIRRLGKGKSAADKQQLKETMKKFRQQMREKDVAFQEGLTKAQEQVTQLLAHPLMTDENRI